MDKDEFRNPFSLPIKNWGFEWLLIGILGISFLGISQAIHRVHETKVALDNGDYSICTKFHAKYLPDRCLEYLFNRK